MSSRSEKETVNRPQDIYVYYFTCDTCGAEAMGRNNAGATPDAWFSLSKWDENGSPRFLNKQFCSRTCLDQWVIG